ncbi:MAG: ribulose-phosphate 3-epimerase, partial [Candidatus Sungbacteria bacterium]|nr:ribulose-phosphate 3-epimerase [Candidatus Sungbacteria bacterium]
WCKKIDMVLILRVPPGASGQNMLSEMLEEISHLRVACPSCIIEADGGINPETASRAAVAGANILVAGAAIFNSDNIEQAMSRLRMHYAPSARR